MQTKFWLIDLDRLILDNVIAHKINWNFLLVGFVSE